MDLRLEMLTEDHARQICSWKYEGIYSIYNFPDWDTLNKQKWGIILEEKRKNEFTAVIDENNNLCGYIRFIENKDFVLVGLGLKPSLCGQGLGNIFMKLLENECEKRYGNKKIALEVRSFNKRAIKCYERAGFKITNVYQKINSFQDQGLNFTDGLTKILMLTLVRGGLGQLMLVVKEYI